MTSTLTKPLVGPLAFILPAPWHRSLVTLCWILSLGFEILPRLHSLTSLSVRSHVLGWVFDFSMAKGWCVPGRASALPDSPISLSAGLASSAGMFRKRPRDAPPSPWSPLRPMHDRPLRWTGPGIFSPSVFCYPSPPPLYLRCCLASVNSVSAT